MLCDILKVKLAMHESEQDLLICSHQPEILLYDNQNIKLNGILFSILHTPGHTKGSICLLFSKFVITGDTLFAGSIGRTDLNSGNETDMINSIKKLKKLNPNLIVYPGHGMQTTIKNEIKLNPYLCLNC
jgi:glyoxylase-like metal-dependent hydrolase (beta-lactamase superfamily II)